MTTEEIRKGRAEELQRFADANRFPASWVMYRTDDGSPITVSDLLRERAQEILKES